MICYFLRIDSLSLIRSEKWWPKKALKDSFVRYEFILNIHVYAPWAGRTDIPRSRDERYIKFDAGMVPVLNLYGRVANKADSLLWWPTRCIFVLAMPISRHVSNTLVARTRHSPHTKLHVRKISVCERCCPFKCISAIRGTYQSKSSWAELTSKCT